MKKWYYLQDKEHFLGVIKREEGEPRQSNDLCIFTGPFDTFTEAKKHAYVHFIRKLHRLSDEAEFCWRRNMSDEELMAPLENTRLSLETIFALEGPTSE